MLRPEQFVISAMPDIEVAQDGRCCLIHMTSLDGKRIDLAFAPEVAPGLANGISCRQLLVRSPLQMAGSVWPLHSCGGSASRLDPGATISCWCC